MSALKPIPVVLQNNPVFLLREDKSGFKLPRAPTAQGPTRLPGVLPLPSGQHHIFPPPTLLLISFPQAGPLLPGEPTGVFTTPRNHQPRPRLRCHPQPVTKRWLRRCGPTHPQQQLRDTRASAAGGARRDPRRETQEACAARNALPKALQPPQQRGRGVRTGHPHQQTNPAATASAHLSRTTGQATEAAGAADISSGGKQRLTVAGSSGACRLRGRLGCFCPGTSGAGTGRKRSRGRGSTPSPWRPAALRAAQLTPGSVSNGPGRPPALVLGPGRAGTSLHSHFPLRDSVSSCAKTLGASLPLPSVTRESGPPRAPSPFGDSTRCGETRGALGTFWLPALPAFPRLLASGAQISSGTGNPRGPARRSVATRRRVPLPGCPGVLGENRGHDGGSSVRPPHCLPHKLLRRWFISRKYLS